MLMIRLEKTNFRCTVISDKLVVEICIYYEWTSGATYTVLKKDWNLNKFMITRNKYFFSRNGTFINSGFTHSAKPSTQNTDCLQIRFNKTATEIQLFTVCLNTCAIFQPTFKTAKLKYILSTLKFSDLFLHFTLQMLIRTPIILKHRLNNSWLLIESRTMTWWYSCYWRACVKLLRSCRKIIEIFLWLSFLSQWFRCGTRLLMMQENVLLLLKRNGV